jgi:Sec-independent protein secretion pathway component TatC
MSILLESDRESSPQSHLDELSLRVTVVFVTTALLTLVWSRFIDDGLEHVLGVLRPCPANCMNVYDPTQWSAVRWLASLMLGLFSALPLMIFHVHRFARPGLLASEFSVLRRWTVATSVIAIIVAYIVMYRLLPVLYAVGHDQHTSAGFVGQYDAVHVVMLALYLVWMACIFLASWLLLHLSGRFGLLTAATADWYRWRLYGVGGLLVVATVPAEAQALSLPLLAMFIITNEAIGNRWFEHMPHTLGTPLPRFDQEGRRRLYGLIDCACLGGNEIRVHPLPEGYAVFQSEGLCRSAVDQERILEQTLRIGLTDLIVPGCTTKACPATFQNNVGRTGATLHGLDLMRLQHHHVSSASTGLQLQLALSGYHRNDIGDDDGIVSLLSEEGWLPSDVLFMPEHQGWGPYGPQPVLFTH